MYPDYVPLQFPNHPIPEQLYSLHYFEYTKDFRYSGEAHDFWELVYIDEGEAVITAGHEEFRIEKGQIYLHRPMEFHNIRCGSSRTACAIIFSFSSHENRLYGISGRILESTDIARQALRQIVAETKAMYASPIDDVWQSNLVPRENPQYGCDRLILGAIEACLVDLIRCYCDESLIPGLDKDGAETLLFTEITRYIEQHYREKISLQDICTAFSISVSSLKKLFSQRAGMGAIEYCISCRVNCAKHLLVKGGMTVSEVAFACGFSSVHYFSRTFRQHTGMSPKGYMAMMQEIRP